VTASALEPPDIRDLAYVLNSIIPKSAGPLIWVFLMLKKSLEQAFALKQLAGAHET
jgi:hypothetical protein